MIYNNKNQIKSNQIKNQMKLIQVTSAKKIEPIYINVDMIGHINKKNSKIKSIKIKNQIK